LRAYLLFSNAAADRAGESLPDIVNVGPTIFQPVRRYDFLPPTAWLAMESKGHAGTGKAGDGAYGDGRLVGHTTRLTPLKVARQPRLRTTLTLMDPVS